MKSRASVEVASPTVGETPRRDLPDFLIIGAMKCGTVSLHRYLDLHPEIAMSHIHEVDFFVRELNWPRGLDWYRSHFEKPGVVVGERSTSYSKYPTYKGVAERISATLPDVKIIYCVRDPIKRIVSHYRHFYRKRYELRSFESALADLTDNQYVDWSRYHRQIQRYLDQLPFDQILIVYAEDLRSARQETLSRVFEFLGVDKSFSSDGFDAVHHRTDSLKRITDLGLAVKRLPAGYRLIRAAPALFERPVPQVSPSAWTVDRIKDALRQDVEALSQLTGIQKASWGF